MKTDQKKISVKQFDKIFDNGDESILPHCDVESVRLVTPRALAMMEKSLANMKKGKASKKIGGLRMTKEREIEGFPGIGLRESIGGHEAYVQKHRVAVWEIADVYRKTRSILRTANHFRLPSALVKNAIAYAKTFPEAIAKQREAEVGK